MKDTINRILIKNAKIVNEDSIFEGDVLIENDLIVEISENISA
jgi:dihydroorotase